MGILQKIGKGFWMGNRFKYVILCLIMLCPVWVYSASSSLTINQALSSTLQWESSNKAIIHFNLAETYRISIASIRIQYNGVELPLKFADQQNESPKLSSEQIYTNKVSFYFHHAKSFSPKDTIQIIWQGCSEQGICYLPQVTRFTLDKKVGTTFPQHSVSLKEKGSVAWAKLIENPDFSGSIWQNFLFFYLAGLLLAFTACMYPLIPIVSSLIVGQSASHRRAFFLSLIYVQAMAAVYAILGGLAAWSGEILSSYIQKPGVIVAFTGLFVLMALAMFGLFQLQLPSKWQSWAVERTQSLPQGHYFSAALLGGVSALLIGPCVAPPLVAALAYISKKGDILLGMSSLYIIAIGIGTPLLIIGVVGQKLLPRLHPKVMKGIQGLFGFVLLGVALWIARPILSYFWWMLSVGVLLILMGVNAYRCKKAIQSIIMKVMLVIFSIFVIFIGMMVACSAIVSEEKIVKPLLAFTSKSIAQQNLPAISIDSMMALKAELARHQGKKVMVNFTADWCIACKEMAYLTLADTRVQSVLKDWLILKVDLSNHTNDQINLLKAFDLYGPPALIFFDTKGNSLATRVIGYQNVNHFLQTLDLVEREAK